MMTTRSAFLVSSLLVAATAVAGCVGEGNLAGTTGGTVFFCAQDDPTVNFNGVLVNYGNIQINQNTSGNNTINDNDNGTADTTSAATTSEASTGGDTNDTSATDNATTSEAASTSEATTPQTQESTSDESSGSVQTINVEDIDCADIGSEGGFSGMFRGQAGGYDNGGSENPGSIADEKRGRSDSPCDRDQGFGNDRKCNSQTIDVKTGDVDMTQFKERKAAFLAKADVQPGTIEQVCTTIDEVKVVTDQGTFTADLQNDTVCMDGPITVNKGQATLVVFKVDLEKSVQSNGDNTFVFAPVIVVHAAKPVTTTITIEETTQTTVTASGNATNDTNATSPSETMMTSPSMSNETASPTATTETTTATNETTPSDNQTASPTPTSTGP